MLQEDVFFTTQVQNAGVGKMCPTCSKSSIPYRVGIPSDSLPDTLGMGHQEQIPLYGPPMSDTSHISHQRCHVTAPLQHN